MDLIESRDVVIRKPRKCWGCATEYPKGTTLNRCATADGGTVHAAYFCAICDQWFAEYDDGEGVEFGALSDDEDWQKIRKEMELKK